MSLGSRILTGTLLGAGVLAAVGYIRNLKKTQAELEIIPTASLHQLTLSAIVVRVDVLLKNPTKGTFSIKFPFVKLIYNGTTIGSSQSVNKDIELPAYGEVKIDQILVSIPVTGLFSTASDILKNIQSGKQVKLLVRVISVVDLGWTQLPYETQQEFVLKK